MKKLIIIVVAIIVLALVFMGLKERRGGDGIEEGMGDIETETQMEPTKVMEREITPLAPSAESVDAVLDEFLQGTTELEGSALETADPGSVEDIEKAATGFGE